MILKKKPFLVLFALLPTFAFGQAASPSFSKNFSPSTIGPGSVSTLTFTVSNNSGSVVTDLAFTDTLPAAVTIQDPANVMNTCNGTVSAPDGGSTISLSGGAVGAGSSCQVRVDVTSSTAGTHTNTSGNLTSSAGTGGTATADLTVASNRPGFSKSFSPDALSLGATSTLTFLIDNTANPDAISFVGFTDSLPAGLEIASPANATGCGSGTLSAPAGGSTVTLSNASLAAGTTCVVSVDVQSTAVGTFVNSSSVLSASQGFGGDRSSGKATDSITVTADPLLLRKSFIDDPTAPGGTVTLRFQIDNLDRTNSASSLSFTDDLGATLTGLSATGLPASNVCGAGSQINGTTLLTFSGGSLAPEASCTFDVTLAVPASAAQGSYPNTTSSITADVGGTPTTGSPGSDNLNVQQFPVLTKNIQETVVDGGAALTVDFVITNTSASSAATDVSFVDEIYTFMSGAIVTGGTGANICGAGSFLNFDSGGATGDLTLTDGTIAAGSSCSFQVTIQTPDGTPAGTYTNTTSPVSATVSGTGVTGPAASDSVEIVRAPLLTKTFTDDPVVAGGTATLEFTLEHDPSAPTDATSISFTDDLDAALTGLTSTSGTQNDICGAGSQISGVSTLTFTGGTLTPGATCTFSVQVLVPAGASGGAYENTTSDVTAMVNGVSATSPPASDDLDVLGLTLAKSFTDDPALAGDTVTLEFTLDNSSLADTYTNIAFTDDLDAALTGLSATGLPLSNVCGAGSQISGTTVLSFTGGSLAPSTSCTFSVTLQIPGGSAPGEYTNTTSGESATPTGFLPARDSLIIGSPLSVTKQFVNDPVAEGTTVDLQITVANSSAAFSATSVSLTDDLDSVLLGLAPVGPLPTNPCGAGSTLSGTSTLTLSNGTIAAGASCSFTVTLQVPSNAPSGSFTNQIADGSATVDGVTVTAPIASDNLVVEAPPSITKSFAGDVLPGESTTLDFTITNLSPSETATNLSFSDDLGSALPGLSATGLPRNDVCGAGSQISGSSVISLTGGTLAAGTSCSFSVDVQVPAGATAGAYLNTTTAITGDVGGRTQTGNTASDTLFVLAAPTLTKSFTDDPVTGGDTVTLEFSLALDPSAPADATSITFTDDLDATLPGLVATGLPLNDVCGAGSQLSGTSVITLTNGTLAPGGTCMFQTTLQVPAGALGTFPNSTSSLTAQMLSRTLSGPPATDTLLVAGGLTFSKTFTDDPVEDGSPVTLEFTLSLDPAAPGDATAIAFTDDLDATLAGLAASGLPASDVCGAGSTLSGSRVVTLSGGTLTPGSSCTFSVIAQVPAGSAPGAYTNTTSSVSATIGGTAIGAPPAIDDLFIGTAPVLSKQFVDDPAEVGGTVLLEFTVLNPTSTTMTDIAFTDDLDAALAGLTSTDLPLSDPCGPGSTLTGTSVITLSGGSLAPGASCTFGTTLQIPATVSPGTTATNTTSAVTATIAGVPVTGGPASDSLIIESLVLEKAFGSAAVPGGQVLLSFTLTNLDATSSASGIEFTDDLAAMLPGATALGLPRLDVCGAGSSVTGTSLVTFSGGSLGPGASCTFGVIVSIPSTTAPGTYTNTTSGVGAGGSPAGGSASAPMVIGPGGAAVSEIPTMSEWALLLLASMVATAGVLRLRL